MFRAAAAVLLLCSACRAAPMWTVVVDNTADAAADANLCFAQPAFPTFTCNFRSAFEFCKNTASKETQNECFIVLPANIDLIMDANYGELSIDIHWPNITVTFYGDGTTITSNGASIERFIDGNLGDALLPEAYKDAPDVAFSVVGVTFIDFGISSTTGSQVNGGAIQMRGFYSIAIINCNFYRNRGYYGGAIQVDLTDRVLIQGCKFIGNFGGFLAGALYISNNNGMLSVRDPLVAAVYVADNYFANNTALYGGGAVSVGFYNFVFFENNLFFENTAIYGGGVFMSYLSIINFEGCHFKWNSADYGGGLIVAFELFFVKVSGCIFEENVGTFGGGLMISKFMNDVIVDGCVFLRNQADSGGGIYVDTANLRMIVHASNFTSNFADRGSSIFVYIHNDGFVIDSCHFFFNEAVNGGVYLGRYNERALISNCLFVENNAENGAAIYVYRFNDNVTIAQSVFRGNRANYGGSIYISNEASRTLIAGCQFNLNSAVFKGGGVYIGVETIFVRILSSLFGENSATSGAAIYIETNNMHITVAQTVFLQNSASESGTVYIGKSNYVTSFLSCQFQYNTATLSGGAIFINVDNLNVNILASTFAMNSAPDGGAVLTKSGNAMLTIYGTSFSSNGGDASSGVGGAINVDTNNANLVIGLTTFTNNIAFTAPALYLGSQNSGKISYSSFNSNSATSGGGAVVLGGSSNVFFFDDSVFEANTAINGGALLVEGGNTVHFDTCQFAFNAASGAGGALWVTDSSTTIANSNFRANEANKFGGALNFENSLASIISISTSLFERNAAISGGGALSIQKYGGFQIQHTKFFQNSVSAGSGSAILIAELSSSAILYCNFTANAASVSGAVQWRHSNRFNEPMNLTSPLNFFSSNTAAYGPNYATQATHISRIDNGETFYSNNFEGDSDQIDVYTLDWYDQVVLSDVHNLARVSVSEPFLCGDAYDFGAVTGGTIVSVVDGLASFRSLQFLCFPAGSMNLNFTATIDGADIEGTYSVQFRSCSRGEYFEGRSCHVCPTGFFSLQNNSDLSVRECLRCPNGAKFCASDIMEVREGYWRMNGDETIPFKCPRDSSSCEGGYSTGASACADGYEGVLCGVCSDGFYLSAASNTCEVCEDSGVNFVSIFFILVGTIVTFAAVVYFVFRWLGVKISLRLFYDEDVQAEVVAKVFNKVHQKFHSKRRLSTIVELENQVHTNPKIASELDDPVSESAHEPVTAPSIGDEESLCHKSPRLTPPMSHYDDPGALGKKDKKKKFIDRISGRIKIYLSLFQILSSFPFILDISYPSSYQTVLSYVGISNFNMPQILGLSCSYTYDYLDALIAMTITPILMAALMFSIVLLLEGFQWLAKATWWWVPQVRKTTIFLFLYGTFLILPGESTIIFRCFNCTNVSSDSDTDTYLLADLSMSCQSDRYLFAWRWAIAMVVIYPIGVPLMYFCLLYQNRRAIQNRCDIEVSENEQNEAHWIRFLYSTYRPKFWFFEVIDTTRRVFLTGVLTLINRGGVAQIVIAMSMALFYIILYAHMAPYDDAELGVSNEISLWQIFIALFIALLLKDEEFSRGKGVVFGIILLINIFSLFVVDLGFFIITPFKGKFFVEVEDIGVDSQKTFVAVPSMSVKSVSSVHVSVSSKSSEEQQQLPPSESIENDIISDFLPPIKTPYHLIEPNSPKNKIVPGDSTESEAIQYVV